MKKTLSSDSVKNCIDKELSQAILHAIVKEREGMIRDLMASYHLTKKEAENYVDLQSKMVMNKIIYG